MITNKPIPPLSKQMTGQQRQSKAPHTDPKYLYRHNRADPDNIIRKHHQDGLMQEIEQIGYLIKINSKSGLLVQKSLPHHKKKQNRDPPNKMNPQIPVIGKMVIKHAGSNSNMVRFRRLSM